MARFALLLCLVACGGAAEPPGRRQPLGAALARVDGQPVEREEVERLARVAGSSAREALERLVAERLLFAHAQRAGYGSLPSVQREVERALVRELLARELGPSSSDPARTAQQAQRLDALLRRLAAQAHVEYREQAIARTFAPEP